MTSQNAVHVIALGTSPVALWHVDGRERVERMAARLGGTPAKAEAPPENGRVVLTRADYAIEESLLADLIGTSPLVLCDPATGRVVGVSLEAAAAARARDAVERGATADEVARAAGLDALPSIPVEEARYNAALRRHVMPFLRPVTAANRAEIERHLFGLSYKGVTDIVTKYVWPWPAYHVTRWCAAARLTPNMVTLASGILVIVAYWLFAQGHFAAGIVAAWAMTFLDTVDGKLARVTVTSTAFGNIFDHGIDLIHPPFWYWAWIVGVGASGFDLWQADAIVAIVIGGYVAQRIEEGIFLRFFGMHMHVWRPFDSAFRTITARRNPNLLLLTVFAAIGRPDWGMIAVAVWTLASLAVHTLQIVQASAMRLRGEPVTSWMQP